MSREVEMDWLKRRLGYAVTGWEIPRQGADTSFNQVGEHDWSSIARGVVEEVQMGAESFEAMTRLLDYYAFLLRLVQGPVENRFDMRWWRISDSRNPVLVRWRRTANKSRSVRVARINAGVERGVAVPEMRETLAGLLALWWDIEGDWRGLRDALRDGKVRPGYMSRHGVADRINGWQEKLLLLHIRAEGDLTRTGRIVQDEFTARGVTRAGLGLA